jgi:hypothetical protein
MAQSSFLRWRNRFLIAALVVAILFILAVQLSKPINLTAVDIGRHIVNGQLILSGHSDVLYKNYYSFTHPDYPFVNHHWLFGVMSYLIFKTGGFGMLAVLYVIVLLSAVFLFLRAAFLRGHSELAVLIALLVLPVLWDRREIRPEGISLALMGLYYFLLTKLSLGKIDRRIVWIALLIAQVIWVNTHIFFFMGPLLIAIFILEGRNRGCSVCVKQLWPLLLAIIAVNMINPSGLAGMLTPLNGLKGFGYRLAENQNVFFMRSFFPKEMIYTYNIVLLFIGVISIAVAIFARGFKKNAAFIILAILAILAGTKAVRLMPIFAVFLIPLGSFFLSQVQDKWPHQRQESSKTVLLAIAVVLAGFYLIKCDYKDVRLGLYPSVNASAEFFKANQLKGPIFSNYDIGGYLIYHFASQEKVYVDNRQEAFPPAFFKDVYIRMQFEDDAWLNQDKQYHFNAIYFYRHDLTEWGQNFLIKRIEDPLWAPVFVDDFVIIFLKRNAANQALISQFELPKSMFGVTTKR